MGTYRLNFPKSNMDKNTHQNSYRLGRRPGDQGPRLLSSDQDRNEKLATGRKRIHMEEIGAENKTVIQLRKTLHVGTWNVRSMKQLG